MSNKLVISILVILLLVIGSVYCGYTWLIEAGYPSCVLSIEDAISRQLDRGAVDGAAVNEEWQILGEQQEQALFSEFRSKGYKFDCKQFPHFADGSALLGSKGHIRFRREGRLIRVRIESAEEHERPY